MNDYVIKHAKQDCYLAYTGHCCSGWMFVQKWALRMTREEAMAFAAKHHERVRVVRLVPKKGTR